MPGIKGCVKYSDCRQELCLEVLGRKESYFEEELVLSVKKEICIQFVNQSAPARMGCGKHWTQRQTHTSYIKRRANNSKQKKKKTATKRIKKENSDRVK